MKCILLAAGYATRLYPLTRDIPKALLPIGNSSILEFLLEKIGQVEGIDLVLIVTNSQFFTQFEKWLEQHPGKKKITVLNDGTTSDENRLGAIADLQFAIDAGEVDDDVLVLAGDNLFDFSLVDFVAFFHQVDQNCITAHELLDQKALRRTGVIETDEQDRVVSFEEKPKQPKSSLAVPPFYLFKRETLPLIRNYLAEGHNTDAPGNFIPWLIQVQEVYAYRFQGNRYDIGTLESYQQAIRMMADKDKA